MRKVGRPLVTLGLVVLALSFLYLGGVVLGTSGADVLRTCSSGDGKLDWGEGTEMVRQSPWRLWPVRNGLSLFSVKCQ